MKSAKLMIFATLAALIVISCSNPPKVAQGKVLSFDDSAKTMVIINEVKPNDQMTFSLKDAEVGAKPSPNDVVRLAYRDQGGALVAIRVMNLTRQKELAKGGKK